MSEKEQVLLAQIAADVKTLHVRIEEVRDEQRWFRTVLQGEDGRSGMVADLQRHNTYFKLVSWLGGLLVVQAIGLLAWTLKTSLG